MRVAERGHDLDLPADVNQVLLILDLLLSDRLYGNLKKKRRHFTCEQDQIILSSKEASFELKC